MTLESINKINQKSKELKFEASRNYKSHSTSSVPYEELVVISPNFDEKIFLVHKNMIFERNSIGDSSYSVYSFDDSGKYIQKEDVSELGKEFFRTMKVIKKL